MDGAPALGAESDLSQMSTLTLSLMLSLKCPPKLTIAFSAAVLLSLLFMSTSSLLSFTLGFPRPPEAPTKVRQGGWTASSPSLPPVLSNALSDPRSGLLDRCTLALMLQLPANSTLATGLLSWIHLLPSSSSGSASVILTRSRNPANSLFLHLGRVTSSLRLDDTAVY